MRNIRFLIGFGWFLLFGNGAGKPLWTALSLYTHRYLYSANKPYTYKRVKDMWGESI